MTHYIYFPCFIGHYYYTEWCRSCQHGDIALMTSPHYVTRQPACLSFWYNMRGHPNDMGPIYLYSFDNYMNEKVWIVFINLFISLMCILHGLWHCDISKFLTFPIQWSLSYEYFSQETHYYYLSFYQVLWTRENPNAHDLQGLWSQVKVNIPAGSYRFIFGSMMRDETEQGDKAIDDIVISEGECSDTPGMLSHVCYRI